MIPVIYGNRKKEIVLGYFHDEPFTMDKSKLRQAYDTGSVEMIFRTANRQ